MNRFVSRLAAWPLWAKVSPILVATAIYLVAYSLLYEALGANATALAILPVAVTGVMLGWQAGIIAGVMLTVLHIALLDVQIVLVHSLVSHVLLITFGGICGWVSELLVCVQAQSELIDTERNTLHVQMAELAEVRTTLKTNEARLNSILQSAMDAIVTIDVAGRIIFFNRAAEEIFQCRAEEAMAQPLSRFIPPNFRDAHQEHLRSFNQSDDSKRAMRGTGVSVGLRANGQTFPLEATIAKSVQNGQKLFTLILRDMTTFAGATRALEESEIRFQSVAESLGEGLLLTDLDDTILYVNSRMVELLDRNRAEMVGQRSIDLLWPPEEADTQWKRHTARRQGVGERYETQLLRRDGTRFWAEIHATPIHDAPGALIGTLGAVTDISDRKRTDDLLHGQQQLLEQIARGTALPDVLDHLIEFVQARAEQNSLVMLLMIDEEEQVLRPVACTSLPASIIAAVVGSIPIGPNVGTCGTAVYRKEPVIVRDITTSPLWEGHQDRLLQHGLRACWAIPILSAEGEALGTFAVYYREPGEPTLTDLRLIEVACHVAGIAIERARAEKALAEERALLRTLLDTLPDFIYVKDREARFILGNSATLEPQGMKATEELYGKTDFDFFPEEYAAAYYADDRHVIDTGQPLLNQEERGIDAEGNPVWLLTSKVPLRDSAGEVIGLVGVGRNITRRKQDEARLRASEAELQMLIAAMIDVILVMDREYRFVKVAPSNPRLLYRPADMLLGRTAYEIFPPEQADFFAREIDRVFASGESQIIEYPLEIDGEPKWFSATLSLMPEDRILFVARDITAQKRVETALRESESKYRSLIEQSSDAIYLIQDGRFALVNRRFAELLGWNLEDVTQPEFNI
ncbi:MAG: PAS domain S-box protein, partial [Anaerolineae bacterium]|nr:PAS domain S-box protein [Anaerolineae bacterium]